MDDLEELKRLIETENIEQKKRSFEVIYENFKATSKAQSRYVNGLILALVLVWGWNLLSANGGISVQVAGVTIRIAGFWQIVPLGITITLLAFAGSVNLLLHSWRRLDLLSGEIGLPKMFFTEFDSNKNLLDYFAALTWRIWRPVLPQSPSQVPAGFEKWKLSVLLYPGLILGAIFTTYHARWFLDRTWSDRIYLYVCLVAQIAFAFPVIVRKVATFIGRHGREHDNLVWEKSRWT